MHTGRLLFIFSLFIRASNDLFDRYGCLRKHPSISNCKDFENHFPEFVLRFFGCYGSIPFKVVTCRFHHFRVDFFFFNRMPTVMGNYFLFRLFAQSAFKPKRAHKTFNKYIEKYPRICNVDSKNRNVHGC